MRHRLATAAALVIAGIVAGGGVHAAAPPGEPSGLDLMNRCGYKYAGEDQRGIFTVILRDREGRMKRSEYLRFWKDYGEEGGVADKMLLFTTFPPEARGSSFMRVAYDPAIGRNVDQWIYLPLLKKIRRVTIRDPGDSFLNSNLTYADVSPRGIDADEHRYLGTRVVDELAYDVVESLPREENPLYGKRVFWFLKTEDPADCVPVRIDYYDTAGELLKDQFITWQRIGDAWLWERVRVRSHRDRTISDFELSRTQVNTGLEDDLFTARSLERGPELIERYLPRD